MADSDMKAADVDAVSKMNVDEIPVPSPSTSASQSMSTNEPATLASPMDISLDVSTDTWPRLEALSWDYTQVGMDWNSHDSAGSQYDTVLASLNAFWDDGDLREGMEPCSPTNLPYPPRPFHPHAYPHSQVGGSNLKGQDGSSRSNIDNCIEGGVDGRINRSTDMYMNWPSLVIAQLSQLSTYLSSLRYSSYTLAEAAESSSAHPPNGQATPLIHAAALESVATWLAHGQGSANMNTQPSDNGPTKRQDPYPSSTPETKPKSSSGILHDVFSASHRLLEILSYLQVRTNVESYNSSTTTSPSTPSTVSSSQNSIYPGLAKGPWPSAPSSGSRQSCNNTMEIIRHLVMACETLLLEIYMAVFMALQHDAYHGACMNTMALGNVKLVLVVQLCSYLMERQHQAVDMCLAPQTAPSTVSSSKTFPDKLDFAGLQQPVSTGPVVGTAGREVLSDFRKQVQQRLAHLWQTVRCT